MCPHPTVTYLLLPLAPGEGEGEQWWKLEWHVTKELNPWGDTLYGSYCINKVEEIEVLFCIDGKQENALLVYASDKAMAGEKIPLSDALKVSFYFQIFV